MNAHPVKQYRESRGLTLQQLADIVGTTISTVSRIENGLQKPSLDLMQRFVDRTDLRADDFLRQSEEAAE